MSESILNKWTAVEVKRQLNKMIEQYGVNETRHLLSDNYDKINNDFKLWIAYSIEPYWKDISDYEHCGFWKKLLIQLKYLLKSRKGIYPVPKNVLESIAETMLPDIRAFFESDEGKKEFEEWKAQKEKSEKTDKGEK